MKFDFWKYQKNNNYRYKKISFITIMIYLFYICMRSNEENSSKNYYSKYLCNLLTLDKEKECQIEFYNNYDFFFHVRKNKKNVNLLIDIKTKTLIEHIILIVGIIPFLKFDSIIEYKIKDINIHKLINVFFKEKRITKGKVFFDYHDFQIIKKNFHILFNYIWEFIPQKYILDNIRYIIKNYYDDACSLIFEKSLNNNYEYFIKQQKLLSNNMYQELISKYFNLL